jgi:hypothetical protein
VIRFDVFGRILRAERRGSRWHLAWEGTDGKHAPAADVVVPDALDEAALGQFLDDHFHEAATRARPAVRRL